MTTYKLKSIWQNKISEVVLIERQSRLRVKKKKNLGA